MDAPWRPAPGGRGLLLLRSEPDAVARWARRGTMTARVVALPRWTAVVPAEPMARTAAPYDDALSMLASRPVIGRLRPALGLFAVDGRAVVTVQTGGWRSVQRWLLWVPGQGTVRSKGLPPARPADLVAVAGAAARTSPREVADILGDHRGSALSVLYDLLTALGLPGAELLGGEPAAGRVVEPADRGVAAFDRLTRDEARHRAEMEGL